MAGKACSWDRWSHEGATEAVIPTNGVGKGDLPGTMETSCCSNSAGIDGTGGKCGRSHLQFQGQHATVEIRNRTNWICGWEWLKDLVGGVPNLAWCNEVSLNFLDGFFLSTKPPPDIQSTRRNKTSTTQTRQGLPKWQSTATCGALGAVQGCQCPCQASVLPEWSAITCSKELGFGHCGHLKPTCSESNQ